jgi:endogenous inhibitor of DNA gyrase (YacG/DUF329 family)
MSPIRIVACPHCGAPVEWRPESAWRPFCSERCKMIDLGAWAAGNYRIAVEGPPSDEASEPRDPPPPRDD